MPGYTPMGEQVRWLCGRVQRVDKTYNMDITVITRSGPSTIRVKKRNDGGAHYRIRNLFYMTDCKLNGYTYLMALHGGKRKGPE